MQHQKALSRKLKNYCLKKVNINHDIGDITIFNKVKLSYC